MNLILTFLQEFVNSLVFAAEEIISRRAQKCQEINFLAFRLKGINRNLFGIFITSYRSDY